MFHVVAGFTLIELPNISIDVPIWVHLIVIACSFVLLIAGIFHLRKMSKRNQVSSHKFHPVWRIVTIGAITASALIIIGSLRDLINKVTNGSGSGPPIVFVQPKQTFIGSDIVACIPDIEGSGGVNLPGWTMLGPVLFNTPRPKYSALVRIPVGIDNFAEVVRNGWSEEKTVRPRIRLEDKPNRQPLPDEKLHVVSVNIPTPQVLERYGILYTAGEKSKLSSTAMETEFGEANRRCGGSSRFHDGSAGGILFNGANMVAGWFGKASQEDVNKLQSHAVDLAYELANKRDSKAFNGKSALDQARYITGQGVEELVRSMNGPQISELEAMGYRVEVNVEFTDAGV